MSRLCNRLHGAIFSAILVLLVSTPASAQFTDIVGIYFDTDYTQSDMVNPDVPHLATAYLVLHNPTQTGGGLGGWECRVAFQGYTPLTQWTLAGNAVNYKTAPEFVVGLADPLPIPGGQVMLASFDMMINEPTPFRIELLPLFHAPSIPDAMSYIPFDDKEILTPMATASGDPTAATYNWIPFCELERTIVQFGEISLGNVVHRNISVTNIGGGSLFVDPVISGAGFSLVTTGPLYVPSGQSRTISMTFTASEVGPSTGSLDLGTDCGQVILYGTGRLPISSYTISSTSHDFGNTPVGATTQFNFMFNNTGETAYGLDPRMECLEFVPSPSVPFIVAAGSMRSITVYFTPTTIGIFQCDLELGAGVTPVPVSGTGHDPSGLISVYPDAVSFGSVYGGNTAERSVLVHNGSDVSIVVHGNLQDAGGPFSMVLPAAGVDVTIQPNYSRAFLLAFSPVAEGTFANTLVFPGLGLEVLMLGYGTVPTGEVIVDPDALDFADTSVGGTTSRHLYIRNYTAADILLTPTLDPPGPNFSIYGSGEPVLLAAGASHRVDIDFHPSVIGNLTAVFRGGTDVPDVPLSGTANYNSGGLTIAPPSLDFGMRPLGSSTELELHVINNNSYAVSIQSGIDPPDGPFTLTAGGSVGVVPPASNALFRVQYAPVTEGYHSGFLNLGPDLSSVPLSGQSNADVPLCSLSSAQLDFPPTPTGGGTSLPLTVTNTGTAPLILDPRFSCTTFTAVTGPDTLEVGETAEMTVLFLPTSVGPHVCSLDLGENMCATVTLTGEAFHGVPVGQTEDVVGVYFDESFERWYISDLDDNQVFEAYLVLKQPEMPEDISGWELRMLIPEGVFLLETEYIGSGLNFMAWPDFLVGLQFPQPALPNVHLATFHFFSIALADNAPLALVPIRNPSIPDAMAISAGIEHLLRPVYPISGQPVVALLNYDSPVAVEGLVARVTDHGVELSWPVPHQAGATSSLWRHGPRGVVDRLTSDAELGRGVLNWLDRIDSYAPGTTLGYSYSVTSGGTEVFRSPVTEVTLPGAGVLTTQLLPNVPNPFNPETSVRFELARAGRVRINVYDVAGRRVARLLDEDRQAGADHVVWRGRDDRGRTVTSGAYYIRLEADGRTDTRKVLLLK